MLTPRQREIIYYRFIEEMEYDEICQIMDINYQSAYNLLQRSLQKVRDTFGTPECIAWISILTTFFRETQKCIFFKKNISSVSRFHFLSCPYINNA